MVLAARSRYAVLALAVASTLAVAARTRDIDNANPHSRLATMDALVHDHGFAIDRSVFVDTVDKVRLGEHFYSSKPPLLSIAGAGVYAVVRFAGLSFRDPSTRDAAVVVVTLVLMLGAHGLLLAYAYRLLSLWVTREDALVGAFAGLALGYLGVGYATSINNHTPAAAVLLAAFYHAYRARHGLSAGRRDWLVAGALAALAPTLDLAALFVSAGLGLYLLTFDWRATLRLFVPAALPVIALHLGATYLVGGSLLPMYLRRELYLYPGSYWLAPVDMDVLDEPKAVYLFHMLVGHHGLFAMTPLLALALSAIIVTIRRRRAHTAEAYLAGGALVVLVGFYAATTKNYGGTCVGFRWLIVVMPVLFLFVAEWLDGARSRAARLLFSALLVVSAVHTADALVSPWQASVWQRAWSGHGL